MDRRAVLKGLFAAGVPAAAAATALAARTTSAVRDGTATSIDSLRQQLESLKTRFAETDAKNQKLIRLAIAMAALSLGVDITAVL